MRILYILLLVIFASPLYSQTISFEITADVEVRDENGNKLTLGGVGGLNQPQIYNLDIDNDGIMDLFVFDRNGGKNISLIHDGKGGYVYKPEFDQIYPRVFTTWVVFKDFDNDGLPDLWFFDEDLDAISLYRNSTQTGDAHAEFELVDADLRAYNHGEAPLDTNDLYCDRTNIPAIEDVDGDGDMDFLTLQTLGYGITLFLNNTVESGKPLNPPSFELADQCWGDFQEYDGINLMKFERDPFCFFKVYRHGKKKHAGGSSLLLLDNDGDSDMDLVLGNAGLNNLNLVINGKKDNGMKIDSMIASDSLFPSNSLRAVTDIFPAAYYQDVNGDGIKDLIVAVNSFAKASYVFREANSIRYYENKGKNDHPVFEIQDTMFLDRDMVDHGGSTSPILYDMDGDGDLDLILGTNGDYGITEEKTDYLVYYENVGTKTNPIYQLAAEDYLGLKKDSIRQLAPCFGDLNRDGNPELLIGRADGSLSLYSINGKGKTATSTKVSDNTYGINVGNNSVPYLVDVDGDSYVDLLIGSYNGNTAYYKNTSKTSSPEFTLEQDTFGNVLPGYWRVKSFYNVEKNEFYDSTVFQTINSAYPVFADLDKNGSPEFILGDEKGKLTIYRDVRSGDMQNFGSALTDPFYLSTTKACYDYNFGAHAKAAIGDINNDGRVDMVVGTERGGFQIALAGGSCNASTGNAPRNVVKNLRIYPNPTNGWVSFKGIEAVEATIRITNIQGQQIFVGDINPRNGADLSYLTDGIYIVEIQTESEIYRGKLIKTIK